MRWSETDYEQIKAYLARSRTVVEALAAYERDTGNRMGTGQLAKKFHQEKWGTPSQWCGTALPVASDAGVAQGGQRGESGQQERPYVAPPEPKAWVQSAGLTRVLIMPDLHLPYAHDLAWRTFLEVARGWRPDVLVMLGDVVDFYCVSQHPKDPARRLSFMDEVRLSNEGLDLISALRIPRVIYCEGNHETRLSRHVSLRTPELHGVVDVRDLLRVKERGWEWVPYGKHISIGKLSFTHDVGFAGAYAARQSVMAFGGSVVIGHTHRAATHYESTVNGERHVGHTMGWLGDPSFIDYRHQARVARESQHGFGVAHILDNGMHFTHFAPIIDGTACVDGRLYYGRGT